MKPTVILALINYLLFFCVGKYHDRMFHALLMHYPGLWYALSMLYPCTIPEVYISKITIKGYLATIADRKIRSKYLKVNGNKFYLILQLL